MSESRVAVVTGAGRGIGAEIAACLAHSDMPSQSSTSTSRRRRPARSASAGRASLRGSR